MTIGREARFWLGIVAAVGLVLWLLRPILLPFVLGAALGYVLDPLVVRLERHGVSRTLSAVILTFGSTALLTLTLVLFMPVLVDQTVSLVRRAPDFVRALDAAIRPWLQQFLTRMRATPAGDLTGPLAQAAQETIGGATGLVASVLSRGLAVVNVLTLLAVTPLVAFYLLRDWPRIVAQVDGWLPRAHADTIRAQAREVDRTLAGFVRGSIVVCAVLAVFYAVALSLFGLDFGLVIGLTAGAVSFVPYLGFLVGLISSVGVALYQFWPAWVHVAIVFGIFMTGQILTDYVLTPRLVGTQVGLHPLWVIFAVFAGGALFGFVGILVAVPVTAVLGVLARFAIGRYKTSTLYRGSVTP